MSLKLLEKSPKKVLKLPLKNLPSNGFEPATHARDTASRDSTIFLPLLTSLPYFFLLNFPIFQNEKTN